MADTIQLINSAAQVTSDAYNRIDRAMSQHLEVNQRSQEFAVEMTAKAAQFAESSRMNDAQIENMKADNYIKGQQFALEQQLMPLKVQSMVMGMEAQKYRFLREKQEADRAASDQIFGVYDDLVGRQLLHTGNTDHAKDYLGYKAQWMSYIGKGGKFDPIKYEEGLNKMNTKYKNAPGGTSDWNPESQYLYESISPKLGRAYELKNPIIKKNRDGIAAGALAMTDAQFGEFFGKYGNLYEQDESGLIGAGRVQFQLNRKTIEDANRQIMALQGHLTANPDLEPQDRAYVENQLKQQIETAKKAESQNMTMMNEYANGRYGISSEPIKKDAEPKKEPADFNKFAKAGPPVLGIQPVDPSDVQGKAMKQRMEGFKSTLSGGRADYAPELEEFKGVDMAWFNENRQTEPMDFNTTSEVKHQIEQNVQALGDLGERFTKEKVDGLLSKIKIPVSIPVSKDVAEISVHTPFPKLGDIGVPYDTSDIQKFIKFGGPEGSKSKDSYKTFDSIMTDLNKIKNIHERRAATEELYAALLTASLSDAVTNR